MSLRRPQQRPAWFHRCQRFPKLRQGVAGAYDVGGGDDARADPMARLQEMRSRLRLPRAVFQLPQGPLGIPSGFDRWDRS
jgi:hypothetical protein